MGFEVVGELFDEPHDPRNHHKGVYYSGIRVVHLAILRGKNSENMILDCYQ
jgi:hypothetical protein